MSRAKLTIAVVFLLAVAAAQFYAVRRMMVLRRNLYYSHAIVMR